MSSVVPFARNVTSSLAAGRLGVLAVVGFVMSAAAPLTVIAGAVTTGYAVTGVTAVPAAFGVVAVVLALFSVGYVAMARHVSNAGAFYTYVARGLGRPAGVGASLVALVAYNCLQVALYGAFGVTAAGLAAAFVDVVVPWWAWALLAWVAVAVLGMLRVELGGRVLAALLAGEIAVVLVYDLVFVTHPGGPVSLAAFNPAGLLAPGAGAVLVLAIAGFVGFENGAVFSEESKDPRRTVAVATFLAVGLIAGLYALSSWALAAATGPDQIVARSGEFGPELMFTYAQAHLGPVAADAGRVLMVTSLFAALLAFHSTVARYGFALGREGLLPRVLGRTHWSTNAPRAASVAQTGIGLVVIVVYAIVGADPMVGLFFTVGMTGGFGALVLITTTAFAVLAYFTRHPSGERWWSRRVAPALAAAGLVGVLVLAVVNFATLIGVDPGDALAWQLPGAFGVLALVGLVWGWWLRARRPRVYAAIGLGPNAATGRASTDLPLIPTQPAGPAGTGVVRAAGGRR